MRCYICDDEIQQVRFDHRDGHILPCSNCQAVITETVQDYDKQQNDDDFVEALVEPLDEFLEMEDAKT